MTFDSTLGVGIVIGAAAEATVGRVLKSTATRIRGVGDAIARADNRATRHRRKLRELRAEQAKTGDESGDLARDIAHVGEVLRRTTRHTATFKRELRALQRVEAARQGRDRALRYGAASLGAGYAAARAFQGVLEQERAAVRLGTVTAAADLGGAVEHARDQIRAGSTLHGETELLGIQYALKSGGLEESAARTASAVVSRVATVTSGATEQVAEVMATTFNNLGHTIDGGVNERIALIGDMLTHVHDTYQFRGFAQLGEGLAEVAPAAKLARLGLGQTATAIGILNSAGYQGSRAGTAMSAVLRQLVTAQDDLGFRRRPRRRGQPRPRGDHRVAEHRAGAIRRRRGRPAARGAGGVRRRGQGRPRPRGQGRAAAGRVQRHRPGRRNHRAQHATLPEQQLGRLRHAREAVGLLGRALMRSFGPELKQRATNFTEFVLRIEDVVRKSPQAGKVIVGLTKAVVGLVGGAMLWSGLRWVWFRSVVMIRDIAGAMKWVLRVTRISTFAQLAYNAAVAAGSRTRLGAAIGRTRLGRRLGFRSPGGRGSVLRRGAGRAGPGVLGRVGASLNRLAPLARVAMAVVGGVASMAAIKILAISAVVISVAWVIRRYWGPLKEFAAGVVGGIIARFNAGLAVIKWVVGRVRDAFTDVPWAEVGKTIIKTMISGLKAAAAGLYDGLKWVFDQSVGRLIPGSDAREGPLSRLTVSGGAILGTMGGGVLRTGPGPLRRPLARQLAAASLGLALAMPAVTAAEAPAVPPPVVTAAEAPAVPPPWSPRPRPPPFHPPWSPRPRPPI